eukprot:12595944-Prorocentrum_lima.AAC.1
MDLDGPALLLTLHGACLQALAAHHAVAFEGLSQAARRSRNILPARVVKSLLNLDQTAAWLRHVTAP